MRLVSLEAGSRLFVAMFLRLLSDLSIGGESDAVNRLKRACSAVLALLNHARITTLIEINF